MKKLLRFGDIIVLICAVLGILLQLWIVLGGTDDRGLYPTGHPGWILSWILSAGVLVFLWLLTRRVGHNRSYAANFPASIPAALGCAVAAIAIGYTGWQQLTSNVLLLDRLTGILGLAGAAALLLAAFCRLKGSQPAFYCYLLPCAFFALNVFLLGRELGGEPEAIRYLFRFLAALSLIPACYQLWGFCVGAGDRQSCLFWCLLSGYLCMLSAPMGRGGALYLILGVWMLTNPCALKYLPRRAHPQAEPQPELPPVTEEALVTEEILVTDETPVPADISLEPESLPEEAPAPAAPTAEPELDPDAIIAEILRLIDDNTQ